MAGVIRVAIVDDHPATAAGLAALLEAQTELAVVGTAGSVESARALLKGQTPDVLLLDIQLGGRPAGFELLREIGHPPPAVILFSSFDYPGFHAEAFRLGARGYLSKTASISEIVAAIRAVAAGRTAFSAGAVEDAREAPRPPSEREMEVIRLVVGGFSNDEIGARLRLSERSVESHLRRLFGRYGLMTRTDLALLAIRQGWVEAGSAREDGL